MPDTVRRYHPHYARTCGDDRADSLTDGERCNGHVVVRLGVGIVLVIDHLDAFDSVTEDEVMIDRGLRGFDRGIGRSNGCFPVAHTARELRFLAHIFYWDVR